MADKTGFKWGMSGVAERKAERNTIEQLLRRLAKIILGERRSESADEPSPPPESADEPSPSPESTPLRDAARTADEWQQPGLPSRGAYTRKMERAHRRGVRYNLQTARDTDPDKFAAGRAESKIAKIEAGTALQAAQRKANEARRAVSEKARITGKYRSEKEDMERRMGLRPEQTINGQVIGSEGYEKMVEKGRAHGARQEAQRLAAEQAETQRLKDWALKHQTAAKGFRPAPSSDTRGGRVGTLPRRR